MRLVPSWYFKSWGASQMGRVESYGCSCSPRRHTRQPSTNPALIPFAGDWRLGDSTQTACAFSDPTTVCRASLQACRHGKFRVWSNGSMYQNLIRPSSTSLFDLQTPARASVGSCPHAATFSIADHHDSTRITDGRGYSPSCQPYADKTPRRRHVDTRATSIRSTPTCATRSIWHNSRMRSP
jgi:hypothetical protein